MLTQVEREVTIALFDLGDNVPGNIADEIERHPTSVSRALSSLEEDGLVETKGRGVWALTPDGVRLARSFRRHE